MICSVFNSKASSLDSKFDKDVKEINEEGNDKVLQRIEETQLSDIFWDKQVPEELTTTNSISSIFLLYLAIQIKEIDIALFMHKYIWKKLI
ncbi:hypothetical protein MCANUF31_02266 [Mycoplasmopsis canis UF31]|uniref:hypothetical protein n=1 Tax=Mycoplasmopsis canis TaxID=29555 RepID=UPI00025AD9DD|nr:hypothetical protein [Mycoplasmopsis canis]EIE40082.1 hypothetical protein MCANUF31_02266 [Mycoplasmopsis canis UF31]